MQPTPEQTASFIQHLSERSPEESLLYLSQQYPGKIVFSTSFGMEDQLITDWIATNGLQISIFTLDTGRLFPETYSTWEATLKKYPVAIKAYYPDQSAIQDFISQNGPNCFYEGVENRKTCCRIRKVEPLKNALKGYSIWITGIRAAQSQNRESMEKIEWDETNQVYKFHPLLDVGDEALRKLISARQIPYNPLHDKGFVSIGCAPCTRAIKPGEDFRAGRWWWEDQSKKECGLHVHPTNLKN